MNDGFVKWTPHAFPEIDPLVVENEKLKAEIERLKRAEAAWELAVSYPEMQLRLVSISHAGWRALKDALGAT